MMFEENSRQNCFASSMLPSLLAYVGITKLKERNMSCTSTGLQLAFQKFSIIHKKTVEKNTSIVLAMMY